MLSKQDKQLLALQNAAKKNPKYRPGVKAKIKAITQAQAWNKFLAQ